MSFTHKIKRIFFSLFLIFFILSTNRAKADSIEKWTLSFSAAISSGSASPYVNLTIKPIGKGQISVGENDVLTGNGQMSISAQLTGPNMSGFLKGKGPFTLTGRRDGGNLYFQFHGTDIPLKGTITVAGMSVPHEDTFSPETLAPVNLVIERKEGAKSSNKHNIGGIKATINYTLSGGNNVKETALQPPGTFPKKENIWVLEFESTIKMQNPLMGLTTTTLKGEAKFPLPKDDGPAVGEGPLTVQSPNLLDVKGKLILRGNIKDDILIFNPKAIYETAKLGIPMGTAKSNYGTGLWVFDQSTGPVKITVENDAELTQNFSSSEARATATATWRLKGEKKELWQMTIDGWNTVGYPAELFTNVIYGGLRVLWKIVVKFEIINGKYHKGSGTAEITKIDPYSSLPGIYNCTVLKDSWLDGNGKAHSTPHIEYKIFDVPGTKSGSEATLYTPNNNHIILRCYCALNKKNAKQIYDGKPGKYGSKTLEDWLKSTKNEMNERGIFPIPGGELLSGCTITLVDGWRKELGNPQSLNRSTITVKRLD